MWSLGSGAAHSLAASVGVDLDTDRAEHGAIDHGAAVAHPLAACAEDQVDVSPINRVRHAARSAPSSGTAREAFVRLAAVTQRVSVTAATRRVETPCA